MKVIKRKLNIKFDNPVKNALFMEYDNIYEAIFIEKKSNMCKKKDK